MRGETNKQVTKPSVTETRNKHTRSGLLRHQKRSIVWWGFLGFGWTVDLARCSVGRMRLARVEAL
jgi:hypothetical protein